jgi:hypothetical protein
MRRSLLVALGFNVTSEYIRTSRNGQIALIEQELFATGQVRLACERLSKSSEAVQYYPVNWEVLDRALFEPSPHAPVCRSWIDPSVIRAIKPVRPSADGGMAYLHRPKAKK